MDALFLDKEVSKFISSELLLETLSLLTAELETIVVFSKHVQLQCLWLCPVLSFGYNVPTD
jgi:hypothetical protein